MNFLPGWSHGQTIHHSRGFADKRFVGSNNSTTAAAERTFTLSLPGPGVLRKIVVGYVYTHPAGTPIAMRLGAGIGDPLTRYLEDIVKNTRGVSIWEGVSLLGNTQTLTVTQPSASAVVSAAMAYTIEDMISLQAFQHNSVVGNEVTTLEQTIQVPDNGVLIGIYGSGDAAPGSVTWNTPGEDADATSGSTGWSSMSVEGMPPENALVRVVNLATITDPILRLLSYR